MQPRWRVVAFFSPSLGPAYPASRLRLRASGFNHINKGKREEGKKKRNFRCHGTTPSQWRKFPVRGRGGRKTTPESLDREVIERNGEEQQNEKQRAHFPRSDVVASITREYPQRPSYPCIMPRFPPTDLHFPESRSRFPSFGRLGSSLDTAGSTPAPRLRRAFRILWYSGIQLCTR